MSCFERAGGPMSPERTISIQSALFPSWTRLAAPDAEVPYWRDAEDGERAHIRSILAGLAGEDAERVCSLHAEGIAEIAQVAVRAQAAGDEDTARRLAVAAGRLCEQIAGHWPLSLT